MFSIETKATIGSFEVLTTENRGFTAEEIADGAVKKLFQ
jgi:hypothetical protein